MEPKRTKYDTNPLDERVADDAEQSWGTHHPAAPTEEIRGGPTHDIARTANESARGNPESEAPTQRIDDNLIASYPSVFATPPLRQPATYQPPRPASVNIYQPPLAPSSVYLPPPVPITRPPVSTQVAGLNIPERWAVLLPYIPGHVGAVAALIELLLVPRTETRTRFHAAQGLALQAAIIIISILFTTLTVVTGSSVGAGLFRTASTIFLIISMVRVWKGRPHHIAPVDEVTKWLDEKIKPRK
jgi:uncharacterized membrane protein